MRISALQVRRRRDRHAFTLLEVVIVAAIVTIVAAIAVPRFGDAIARQRVDAAARRIATDIAYAQRRARLTSAPQTVRFRPGQNAYLLIGVQDIDHSANEYRIELLDDLYGAKLKGTTDFGGDRYLIFNGYGVPDSGGSAVIKVNRETRTITVDPATGRTQIN